MASNSKVELYAAIRRDVGAGMCSRAAERKYGARGTAPVHTGLRVYRLAVGIVDPR